MYSIEEKLQIIRDSSSLNDILSQNIMPDPDSGEGYYFVSYSHKDYKEVLTVILQLRELGVKIWYDRGLETGKSWSEEVKRRIFSYHCKGVMFFASERFFASDSTLQEYKMTVRCRKNFVIIDMTGGKMEEKIAEVTDPKASEFFKKYWEKFPVVMIDDAINNIKLHLLRIKPPSLFNYTKIPSEKGVFIKTITDLTVKDIKIPQFRKKNQPVAGVDEYCFANCISLETIAMPQRWRMINDFAFYNCRNLTTIMLGAPTPSDGACLSLNAFTLCENLKELTIPANVNIFSTYNSNSTNSIEKIIFEEDAGTNNEEYSFAHCHALKEILNPPFHIKVNGACCSSCTSLEKIDIPEGCEEIEEGAFEKCKSLQTVTLPSTLTAIESNAFIFCTSLLNLDILSTSLFIDIFAFYGCAGLTQLSFASNSNVTIELGAFAKCESLQTIHFGRATSLDLDSFVSCTHLHTVIIDGTITQYKTKLLIDDIPAMFDYDTFQMKAGNRARFMPETVFPYATTFYIAAGADKFVPSAFKEAESDRAGYTKYVK